MRYFGIFWMIGLTIAFGTLPNEGSGQGPQLKVHAQLTPDTILIGARVELTIHATLPQEHRIQFPQFADTLSSGIEVAGVATLDTLPTRGGQQELVYRLMVTSFDSGVHRVPRLPLLVDSGTTTDTAYTSPMWLKVNLLPRDEAIGDMHDIKPPFGAPLTFREVAPWVGAWLALLALVALGIYAYRRHRSNKPLFFAPKPKEPAHVIALRELDAIKAKRMWESEDHKLFFSACTDTLRRYIEGRFEIPAMEQTTHEIIGEFKSQNQVDAVLLGQMEDMLSLADLVKFARFAPGIVEKQGCLDFAYRFVHSTALPDAEAATSQDQASQPEGKNVVE